MIWRIERRDTIAWNTDVHTTATSELLSVETLELQKVKKSELVCVRTDGAEAIIQEVVLRYWDTDSSASQSHLTFFSKPIPSHEQNKNEVEVREHMHPVANMGNVCGTHTHTDKMFQKKLEIELSIFLEEQLVSLRSFLASLEIPEEMIKAVQLLARCETEREKDFRKKLNNLTGEALDLQFAQLFEEAKQLVQMPECLSDAGFNIMNSSIALYALGECCLTFRKESLASQVFLAMLDLYSINDYAGFYDRVASQHVLHLLFKAHTNTIYPPQFKEIVRRFEAGGPGWIRAFDEFLPHFLRRSLDYAGCSDDYSVRFLNFSNLGGGGEDNLIAIFDLIEELSTVARERQEEIQEKNLKISALEGKLQGLEEQKASVKPLLFIGKKQENIQGESSLGLRRRNSFS